MKKLNTNYKLVNKKYVEYDVCYKLHFTGDLSLNNCNVVYFNRDQAILEMIEVSRQFLTQLSFEKHDLSIQKTRHDLDCYLTSIDCFKDGDHVALIQLSEMEIKK